jgi:hypothetical protein
LQVFDADVFDAARPSILCDSRSAEAFFESGCDRCVERDRIVVDCGDNAVPAEVARAGPPTDAERVGRDGLNPFGDAWSRDDNRIADV